MQFFRMECVSLLVAVVVVVVAAAGRSSAQEEPLPPGMKKMKFKGPDMDEEEQLSRFLPDHLQCDGCSVVAYQMNEKFKEYNRIHKHYKNNLPESEIIDLLEKICEQSNFESYGVKTINGDNRLSGVGLETKDEPGTVAGGGKWPGKISNTCFKMVEDLGDEGIYEAYLQNPGKLKPFRKFLCYGDTKTTNYCKRNAKKKQKKEL